MEPENHTKATLVDLLDRILDKGLVIHADLIVSVAGIPLIGLNLKAALAGMETMVKYGMMKAWDERMRAQESEARSQKGTFLSNGEEVLLTAHGGWYCRHGLHPAWRYGHLYLTPERLCVYQHPFERMLFEVPLTGIVRFLMPEDTPSEDGKVRELHLVMADGHIEKLRCTEASQLLACLDELQVGEGVTLDNTVWKTLWRDSRGEGPLPSMDTVCKSS
ncbi:gas vesicle protein GvpJ [Desulfoluna spongiiphila]|uniref:Gas vesicle protein n=1 Tax=Desulfoluna spongiiphila TaxID=419481 RepID=A0A1G5CN45_9BACT|nr:gas vesicle protein GvpJ [Desulfoluna spongiiphila]SCY03698.1 Gas vesicle protein [Desulfoluna spongiiphila]